DPGFSDAEPAAEMDVDLSMAVAPIPAAEGLDRDAAVSGSAEAFGQETFGPVDAAVAPPAPIEDGPGSWTAVESALLAMSATSAEAAPVLTESSETSSIPEAA